MLSDPEAQHAPGDWYLIASDGDLVLRLVQDLQIGEDGHGDIVLSPAREDALLKISVREGGLTLQAIAMDWTFRDQQGSTRQHATFGTGATVKMNFPTCSLVITPDFRAGERARPDCELDLRPIDPPTVALTRVAEPITLVDVPAVTWQTLPPIGVATTEEVAALLEAGTEDEYEGLLGGDHDVPDETPVEIPVLREPVLPGESGTRAPIRAVAPSREAPATSRSTTVTSRAQTPPRKVAFLPGRARRGLLAALLAALVLLVPMTLLLEAPEDLGVRLPLASYLQPGQVVEPVWPEDPPPAPVVRPTVPRIEPTVTVTDPATAPGSTGGSASPAARPAPFEEPLPLADRESVPPAVPATPAPSEPPITTTQPVNTAPEAEMQAARVADLLAEAQALYDADAIVTPVHENAVNRLTELLTLDPTNEAGLRLMYESAMRLTEEARAAHDAGDDYLARNLLEDVLGFHPDFQPARQLQQDWTVNGNG